MYPQELELTIDDIAQGGDGVGRWEGRVVFVRGALPGERVRVRIREQREAFAKGEVLELLEASPDRVEPRLPGADHMSWQHIAYDAQLRFKRAILVEQLAKFGGIHDLEVPPMIAAPRPWNYRNTAHLNVQGAEVGYYAAGSRRLVPLREDPLLLPSLNRALAALSDLLATSGGEGGRVRHVTLRTSTTHGYSIGVLDGSDELAGTAWRWRMRDPGLAGVLYPDEEKPEEGYTAEGISTLTEEFGGVSFRLDPQSFFQVHTPQAEQLLRLVREGLQLQGGERLLDAYSGVGALSLPLAHQLSEIVAVEENPGAIEDGDETALLNGIKNVRFVQGQVERMLSTLDGSFDAAILDPPRRGCHPAALAAVRALAPTRLAYVSCSPGILARDLKLLGAPSNDGTRAYVLRSVVPVDMFPQTPHIECVAIFELEG